MANTLTIPAGYSVQEILSISCDPILRANARVWLHGMDVTDVEGFHAQAGDRFVITLRPLGGGGDGGKSPLAMVLSIVVAVAAWYVAPMIIGGAGVGGAAGWAGLTASQTFAAQLTAMAINMVGQMAVAALIPPPKINTGLQRSTEKAESYQINGQSNQARPFGAVLKLYGRHKMMPLIAANPIIDNVGRDSAFSQLFDFGFGDVLVDESTLLIGDVPLSEYDPTYYIYRNAIVPDLRLVTNRFGFDQYSVVLHQAQPFVMRTKPNTNQAQVTLAFQQGLFRYNNDGSLRSQSADFRILWRKLGTTEWSASNISFQGANAYFYSVASEADLGQVFAFGSGLIATQTNITVSFSTASGTPALISSDIPSEITATINAAGGVWGYSTNYPYTNTVMVDFAPMVSGTLAADKVYSGRVTLDPAMPNFGYAVAVTGVNRTPAGDYIADINMHMAAGDTGFAGWQYTVNLIEQTMAALGSFRVEGAVAAGFNLVAYIDFPAADEYEIYLERTTPISTSSNTVDSATLTLLESRVAGDVLKLRSPHTLMEMRVQATDKLNGVVQTLSAVGTSVLRTTTNGVTFTNQPTRNPAWICLDILTGSATPKPLPDSQVDWPSWIALAEYCDEPVTRVVNGVSITQPRFTCDTVIDYETTCGELVDSVLSACRSSRTVTRGGKYGVLIDQEKTIPRQIITPKNSWSFSGNRAFVDVPHALRVSYIDGDVLEGSGYETWNRAEIVVYRDGYDVNNATIFEDLGSFGITDYASAWSYGRYMMAQGVFRNEMFSLTMDVENVAVSRGDLVEVQHDVPMVGGIASYVVSVVGNDITITETLASIPSGYSVRLANGSIRSGSVVAAVDANTFTLDNAADINEEDLIVLGTLGRVTGNYIVSSVTPSQDLTADLLLLRYVPEVYRVDSEPIPEYFPDFGDDFINSSDMQVINLTASAQRTIYVDRVPYGVFDLNWQIQGFQPARYELLVTYANGETDFITDVQGLTYEHAVNLVQERDRGGIVSFELTPYTAGEIRGIAGTATSEVIIDTTGPGEVPGFGLDVQDMTCVLYWRTGSEPDIEFYVLRYSADVNGTWDASQLIGTFGYATNRTSVGARTGRYFIRAIDTSGNAGAITSRRTTVEFLPNLEQVEVINDDPTWLGAKSGVVFEGGNIVSAGDFGAVNPLGYYEGAEVIDLGAVCEVRVSSKIKGYGKDRNDVMATWIPLASISAMANATADEWNLRLEYQVASTASFMVNWQPLSSPAASPIAQGAGAWSAWRPIEVSDVTGRFIKFRMRVESFSVDVKAVMTDGRIEIDAPDRTLKEQNVAVPLAGLHITFAEAFMFRPSLAITIDNAIDALGYRTSNIDKFGFDIELFDTATQDPAAGVIDWAALGNGKLKPSLASDFFRSI